ncbi:XrtA system polysaccharide chain length determinant [Desulfococcus sp.]|uniref:XrtA system polysaccharide chain length determinant n=1 Tax=Desulfococcus sp. TaxID=2025834 RepID=UPI003594154A
MDANRPDQQASIDISYYVGIVLKYRWFIIVPFCVAVMAGMVLSIVMPKVYTANTLILVQSQRVPEEYVQPLVSGEIESRINTISQQILSRTNLEKIIEQFKLFNEPKQASMYMEDKIEALRKRISVEILGDKKRPNATDAFSITFKGNDPEKVMNITNTLAESFIEENLKTREEEALGTNEFLEDQLLGMRTQLGDLEKKVEAFRTQNMGGLPEQLDSNLRVLDRLQAELTGKNESIRDARNRLVALDTQVAEANVIHQAIAGYGAGESSPAVAADPYTNLQNMQQKLAELSARYTKEHPEIIRLESKIRKLEKELESNPPDAGGSVTTRPIHPDLLQRQSLLKQQRQETQFEIESLKNELTSLVKEINRYQRLVDDTPKKEHELSALKRDYENIKMTYNSLLDRKMQAQISVNLEKNKKGEQFRIIDRAKYPNKPSEPDMKKLFAMTIAGGLGIGGGIVFLFIFLNNSITRSSEIELELGLPVLASIPAIYTDRQKRWHKINNVLSSAAVAFSLALCGCFAFLALKGPEQAIKMIKTFI